METALGLAAPLLTCKVAHSVRVSCKSLYETPPLRNRCTFEAFVAEQSGEGLAANDRDISFDVGFSIDSDGNWHGHGERQPFDSGSDFEPPISDASELALIAALDGATSLEEYYDLWLRDFSGN